MLPLLLLMFFLLPGAIVCLQTHIDHPKPKSNPAHYFTNFANASQVLADWTLDTECSHCSAHGGDECTQFVLNATQFGAIKGTGMIHTTRKINPTISQCVAGATSGHLTWNPSVLYGNFTVVARWFPGTEKTVSSATGFIGLDAPNNEASITMGFHGLGWPKDEEGPFRYQHGIYADVKEDHNRGYTNTTVNIADNFNTYNLVWTKEQVIWSFNGDPVRVFQEKKEIPSIAMNLRLHTRSGYTNLMPEGATFEAYFLSFEYSPL
eukprot:m.98590 g.98590  ORF g.98590 m.98590 type:complete len:264 (+) comp22112_c0_seq1:136-927(+)